MTHNTRQHHITPHHDTQHNTRQHHTTPWHTRQHKTTSHHTMTLNTTREREREFTWSNFISLNPVISLWHEHNWASIIVIINVPVLILIIPFSTITKDQISLDSNWKNVSLTSRHWVSETVAQWSELRTLVSGSSPDILVTPQMCTERTR